MQDYILEEIRKEKQLQAHEQILQMRDAIDEFVAFSLDPVKRRESCWSNAFPLTRYNFDQIKGKFRDCIALRYGGREPIKKHHQLVHVKAFNVAQRLHCPKRGYGHTRHQDRCNAFTTIILDEVCNEVQVEHRIQICKAKLRK